MFKAVNYIICLIFDHKWIYENKNGQRERYCKRCNIRQRYISGKTLDPYSRLVYWKNINK